MGPFWCRNPRKQASNPGRLALLNCILVSHKYFSNPAMKQGVLLEQESKEAGIGKPK